MFELVRMFVIVWCCLVNSSSLMLVGGWGNGKPLDSVQIVNLSTGRWTEGTPLEQPRYGHACLRTQLRGQDGILVTGGALTGGHLIIIIVKPKQHTT